jgi:hypothetical protein
MMVSAPVAQTRRKWAFWLSATLVVLVIGASIVRHVSWDSAHLKETVAQHAEMHYVGVATWTNPIGSNLAKLPESAAMVVFADMQNKEEPTQQGPRIHIELWSPEQKVFSVEAPRPATLAIRLLSYPAWQAKLNGVTVSFETDHQSRRNQICTNLGPHDRRRPVRCNYSRTFSSVSVSPIEEGEERRARARARLA